MAWSLSPYSLPPLVAAVVAAVVFADAWRRREEPLGWTFAVLMGLIAAWSLLYGLQIGFTTLGEQLLFQRLGITIGVVIPTVWLVLTMRYAGYGDLIDRRTMALLAVDPAVTAALVWTNGSHGLFWSDVGFVQGPPSIVELAFGPAYLAHFAYAYVIVVIGILLVLSVAVRAPAYRLQASLLAVGAVVPLGANVAFTLGLSPVPEIDLTTTAFTLTGVVFGLALFRFDLLNLRPVARRRVIDELGNGIAVVDADGRVVRANAIARSVLPGPVAAGAPVGPALGEAASIADLDGEVLVDEDEDGRRRFYQCRTASLSDHRDRRVGRVLALQDVTDRREYEQRLEVTNRLLRHNLRNDMTKIVGWADLVQAGQDPDQYCEYIQETAERVGELSRKAGRIERTLSAREDDPVAVDLVPAVVAAVESVREEHPEADLAVDAPDRAPVLAPDDDLLETAVFNVVENAVLHSDRPAPTVRVTVETPADRGSPGDPEDADEPMTTVSVADDGPGIPEMELATIRRGGETDLSHGSGLGLWLVNWIVAAAGGTADFEENDPRGSVVSLSFRTPDSAASPDDAEVDDPVDAGGPRGVVDADDPGGVADADD